MASPAPPRTRARVKGKRRPSPVGVSFGQVLELAAKLPGAEEGLCYGTPGIRVKGKFLLRLRDDGESVAIKIPMDDREVLLQADPKVFYITDHYRGFPAILFRLTEIRWDQLADLLELGWRFVAPKRLNATFDAGINPK